MVNIKSGGGGGACFVHVMYVHGLRASKSCLGIVISIVQQMILGLGGVDKEGGIEVK